jgi:uncharacterized protein
MSSFFSGLLKGGVVAGAVLGVASVLLPDRPEILSQTAANDPALKPSSATPDPSAQTVAEPVAPIMAAPEPVATEPVAPEPIVNEPLVTEPVAPEPAPIKEALLDPQPAAPAVTEPAAPEPAAPEPAAPEPAAPELVASAPPVISEPAAPAASAPAEIALQTPVAPPVAAEPVITAPVADPAPEPATNQPEIAQTIPSLTPEDTFLPPLQKYAAPFDDTGSKPLFAVILRDTGGADVDRAALAALPLAITFAIDPQSPNATEAMSIYRAAGKEVVMLVADLPAGATSQDLEQNFQIYDAILPETVAVMGPAFGGFQDSATLAQMIVPLIAAQGRGMVTFDRGLNSAAQVAAREGLASGEVFRQIDGGGESVPVIRRYLDRAVFKAVQEGAAMVMGETAPNTIEALAVWAVEGRASEVTLAPVSAVLK